jgi:hypothetical protein
MKEMSQDMQILLLHILPQMLRETHILKYLNQQLVTIRNQLNFYR